MTQDTAIEDMEIDYENHDDDDNVETFKSHFRCPFCKASFDENEKLIQHLKEHKIHFTQDLLLAFLRTKKLDAVLYQNQTQNLKDSPVSKITPTISIIYTELFQNQTQN